jgi:twinkle protein
MFPTIQEWYDHGYPKGAKARIENFDDYLTFVPGQLTMITGIPGHGKDEFANLIMANLARHEGWIWGICSFEETPQQTSTKLMEKYIGKSFDFRQEKSNRITQIEYERSLIFVDDHFKFMDTENIETDLISVLSLAEKMVRRFGIKGFCINPWNWLEHQRDSFMSETEYVSVALSKIIQFAKRFQVHIFLMAHPTKVQKSDKKKYDVPTLYSISGSANFFNKTHNGITVYRDVETVDIHVQKVKQSWLGKVGLCQFTYNTLTRQYTALTDWTPKLTSVNNLF